MSLILLFDHFRDRLGYCLAAFGKQFEHLKQRKIFVYLLSLKLTM
jgi:hypothetical protein